MRFGCLSWDQSARASVLPPTGLIGPMVRRSPAGFRRAGLQGAQRPGALFQRFKDFRVVATRSDKHGLNFFSGVVIAALLFGIF